VLPIGGLKEKALGALRAGITTVILPEKNKKDLVDIPRNVKRKIRFHTVGSMDEVLTLALEPLPEQKRSARPKNRSTRKRRP
jgi:ATP-dependent Lon protease